MGQLQSAGISYFNPPINRPGRQFREISIWNLSYSDPTCIAKVVVVVTAIDMIAYAAYDLYAIYHGNDNYDEEEAYQEKYVKSEFQKMRNGNTKRKCCQGKPLDLT